MKVGILGAGEYGRALGTLIRRNGNVTYFYDPFLYPERILRDVVEFSDALVLAVPSSSVVEVLSDFPAEGFNLPLIVTTKGFLRREYYEKFAHFEILSGPGFADDIVDGKRVKLTVAGRGVLEAETFSERLVGSSQVSFDKTEDVYGVMLLGALKNIYAIESGRRNLEFKSEDFKEFIYDSIREAQKVLLFNGAFMETARLSAGVGDFVLTAGSEKSRNYRFGRLLFEYELESRSRRKDWFGLRKSFGLSLPKNITIEGVNATEELLRQEVFIPRELEILPDIIRRIRDAIKR